MICTYCRQLLIPGSRVKRPVVEHVEPLSRGGEDVPENTVLACASCNNSKGNSFLLEWVWSGRFDKHLNLPRGRGWPFSLVFDNAALVRLRGDMSQRELAVKAGVSRITIVRLERGDWSEYVRSGTLNRLATALGVSARQLLRTAAERTGAHAREGRDVMTTPLIVFAVFAFVCVFVVALQVVALLTNIRDELRAFRKQEAEATTAYVIT